MGQACCGFASPPELTEEEKTAQRSAMRKAADERSSSFQQGGGGEALKAKSRKLEEAEKKNREAGRGEPGGGLNPRQFD